MRRTTRERRVRNRSFLVPKEHHVAVPQPNNDVYDPEQIPHYFQISVNILEARKLAWSNPQTPMSYVMVVLGRKKYHTTVRKCQEDPCYGELLTVSKNTLFQRKFFHTQQYLIFDIYMSIREIQRSSLWLVVMEPKCFAPPRMLGEATVDLMTVWNLPSHQMYHKWLQLSLPKESNNPGGSAGFLKVDVSITPRGGVQVMPAIISENRADDHLLLATGCEQQPARYLVTVHAGFTLPSFQNERRYYKGTSTFVRVTFCGLMVKKDGEIIPLTTPEAATSSRGKTSVQKNTNDPRYNEQISMVEMFPNTNQVIKFEVCLADTSFNRVIACTELKLGEVSHDGDNGFLPTFGPSLLHMYSESSTMATSNCIEDGPFHKGALLVSLRTVVPYYLQSLRTVSVEQVPEILPDQLWVQEECFTYCAILEMSMLDPKFGKKGTGAAMTIGEIPSERPVEEEFDRVSSHLRAGRYHYTGSLQIKSELGVNGVADFNEGVPVLQLCTRLPDFRFRMYRNNMILRIINDLEQNITNVEKQLQRYDYKSASELADELNRAIDDAAGNILKFLDIVNYSSNCSASEDSLQQYTTDLDQRQLNMQKEEIEKVYNLITKKNKDSMHIFSKSINECSSLESLTGTRKSVKYILAEVKTIAESLRNTIVKTTDGWPYLMIWLVHEGSRVAYKKFKFSESIYSVIPEQCGLNCSKIQTIYLKPLKCPRHGHSEPTCVCIAGKMEVLLWTGLFRQRHAFGNCMPADFHLKIHNFDAKIEAKTMMLEIRVFVYKAKLTNEGTRNKPYNTFVRIHALRSSKDSQVVKYTSTPIWNQVLKMKGMVYGTSQRLYNNTPYVLVEVYNDNFSESTELLGRFQIQPVIEDRPDYAPKLQWYEIFKSTQRTGQIMMSTQLLPIPEQMLINTVYFPYEQSVNVMEAQTEDPKIEPLEVLPEGLIPRIESYKADIYWWGLREVNITKKPLVVLEIDDLVIKSDIIPNKKSNSNFPNGKISQVFQSTFCHEHFPTLSIKLYDNSTFGRTLFLGTNIIKRPNKFLIEWLPEDERNASIKSASIISSDFCDVGGEKLYVKKKKSLDWNDSQSNTSLINPLTSQAKTKNNLIDMIFRRREFREEELTLLPVYVKENDKIKVVKKMEKFEYDDWWTRFYLSQKLSPREDLPADYIMIYDYELELQPEFSKFKDWCSTLKLYNGKKTGIPEKDKQLQCGFLKAGIVIYRWPPPEHTVAVAYNGVELENGYFGDYPDNEPAKYVVRVYIVKGINLQTTVAGKVDPYVVINCGKRQLGDRKNHTTNTTEPIFGKMFEFNCNFPEDYSATISVYDYDSTPPDELIGCTTIDLEDRVFSKHRARAGLPFEYTLSGPSKWRDNMKPSAILDDLCAKNHIPPPHYPNSHTVVVNGIEYKENTPDRSIKTAEERKENICLSILHKWQTLPLVGYQLVPEHVETRSLYHPDTPGFGRGKIQLWVDLFPLNKSSYVPLPRNITPRKLQEYELRVIVWDVRHKAEPDKSKSWKTADLYVKVWIGSTDNAQQTDIHYNSLSGEGNFNWRMVFTFMFNHAEKKLVIKEKGPFTEYEQYAAPILHVHVIQSSKEEVLGVLSLNLNVMYKGSQSAKDSFSDANNKAKFINLFSLKSTRSWWPLKGVDDEGNTIPAGVIDLEMTLLPKEDAVLMPVGVGRDAPMPLPQPNRSFKMFHRGKDILILVSVFSIIISVYMIFKTVPFVHNYIMYMSKKNRQNQPCQQNSKSILRVLEFRK